MRKTLLLLVPVALLGACTWGITLNPEAAHVHTAWTGDLSSCRNLGRITVTVMDHVGPVDRNDIKVRDELEVMARNQAATMHADTVQPAGDPTDGSQSWVAYSCGRDMSTPYNNAPLPPPPGNRPPSNAPGNAQTYPVK